MRFCRFCGAKEIQFRKSGKFGCVHCAQIFNYPKPNRRIKIPENQIQTLESFIKENLSSLTLFSLRTRITRNLKSSLFPFYDPLLDKSKQLLVESGFGSQLYLDTNLPSLHLEENPEPRMGFYLGSEDHIRWEEISFHPYPNRNQTLVQKRKRFLSFGFCSKNPIGQSFQRLDLSLLVLRI